MMVTIKYILLSLAAAAAVTAAQNENGIDPDALIERIMAVDQQQRSQVRDVTLDAEYVEREDKGKDGVKEKVRFLKKVYVKYLQDTTWYHEEYLEYYKEGELQEPEKMEKQARDRRKKKEKRKGKDISYPMLKVFYPGQRELYDIEYFGVADERIEDHVCHLFRVTAKEKSDTLINGDFYFEAEGFHLVRADFSPSKLVRKIPFKLTEMNMSIVYAPTLEGYWLPRQFDIQGKGKAIFFFGVKFAGTEYYRNPVVNSGLEASLFEGKNDSKQ
jgi:hypothetical protein